MPIKRKGIDAYDADMRLWRERDRAYRRDQYRARRHAETASDAETRDDMFQLDMPYAETDDAETRHVGIGADAEMKEWKERDRAYRRARRRAR